MNHRIVVITALVSALILLEACASTVHPGQRGLRFRPLSQGLVKDTLRDGTYFHFPWNNIIEFNVRWQSFTEKVDALSADDLPVSIHSAITLRPIEGEIYFLAQEIGQNWYHQVVRPQFLAAVRNVVSDYAMVSIPERSIEIGNKIEGVMVEALKGQHLMIASVALAEIEFSKQVLDAVERKQAKEQEKEQKEFEILIANKDAEIARISAKGQGDSIRIRAEGEAEGQRIRAAGQARAQEIISGTLTPEFLRFKLYDSPNAKLILLPDNMNVPLVINPGTPDQPRPLTQGELQRRESGSDGGAASIDDRSKLLRE